MNANAAKFYILVYLIIHSCIICWQQHKHNLWWTSIRLAMNPFDCILILTTSPHLTVYNVSEDRVSCSIFECAFKGSNKHADYENLSHFSMLNYMKMYLVLTYQCMHVRMFVFILSVSVYQLVALLLPLWRIFFWYTFGCIHFCYDP